MRHCIVSYKVQGNGPWNYCYESPPKGADRVYTIGWFIRETDTHYVLAKDLVTTSDGGLEPVREVFFTKDQLDIRYLDEAKE